jgi:hypothetical protein
MSNSSTHRVRAGVVEGVAGTAAYRDLLDRLKQRIRDSQALDPYVFDFLELDEDAHERQLEQALIEDIQRFLLEIGAGFAFYGRQRSLIVGGQEFFHVRERWPDGQISQRPVGQLPWGLESTAADTKISTVDRHAESLGFVVQYHLIPVAKANGSPAVVVHA